MYPKQAHLLASCLAPHSRHMVCGISPPHTTHLPSFEHPPDTLSRYWFSQSQQPESVFRQGFFQLRQSHIHRRTLSSFQPTSLPASLQFRDNAVVNLLPSSRKTLFCRLVTHLILCYWLVVHTLPVDFILSWIGVQYAPS